MKALGYVVYVPGYVVYAPVCKACIAYSSIYMVYSQSLYIIIRNVSYLMFPVRDTVSGLSTV